MWTNNTTLARGQMVKAHFLKLMRVRRTRDAWIAQGEGRPHTNTPTQKIALSFVRAESFKNR